MNESWDKTFISHTQKEVERSCMSIPPMCIPQKKNGDSAEVLGDVNGEAGTGLFSMIMDG